jgi:flagellar motor switch protein FliN
MGTSKGGRRRPQGKVPAVRQVAPGAGPQHPNPALNALAGLEDVEVDVTLEWGRSRITVQEALALDEGALLRLDQHASDPVDILVNGRLFGRGKLVVSGDAYGVQLLEVVSSG